MNHNLSQINKPQLVDLVLRDQHLIHINRRRFEYLESLFHFHDHNVYELVWIEKSYGKRFVGDHIGDFESGDLVLMGPQLPHKWINNNAFYINNKELYAQTTVLHFDGNQIAELIGNSGEKQAFDQLADRAKRGVCLYGNSRKKAIVLLNRINEESGLRRIIHFLQLIEVFCSTDEYKLLSSTTYKNSIDMNESKRMNDVYEYVMKNFQSPITLDEIAKVCCMARTAFCRFFKNHRNLTFIEFLNEIRISHACKLLRETDLPIMDICFECGFNNTVNFNKFFKKVKKTTPARYRMNLQELSEK